MPDLYEKHLPPPETAVELPPEELALSVLQLLSDPNAGSLSNRFAFSLMSSTSYPGKVDRRLVATALAEAFAWLEREGLIVRRPGDTGEFVDVSRRGKKLTATADFDAYRRAGLLRRDSLDPLLVEKVWPLFIRGDYDVAVFQAFKLVEVRVRELGGYSLADIGMTLMRKAFHPTTGTLTDPADEPGERDALQALFAGAIGTFKSPGSHRIVKFEPAEAAEAVYLANTLLRMLGRIEARLKGPGGIGGTPASPASA